MTTVTRRTCFATALLFFVLNVLAQSTSISNDPGAVPDASAMLDVQSTNKGFLIPRMTAAQRGGISNPAKGLLIYQIDLDSGFYYNSGSSTAPQWIILQNQLSGWGTKGNANTDPTINFIGTTDQKPLLFRINNVTSGIIDSAKSQTAFGYKSLNSITTGSGNTAIGLRSLEVNNTGENNIAVGTFALRLNSAGSNNTAAGSFAMTSNLGGSQNSAFGYGALNQNSFGTANNAVGAFALTLNYGAYNNAVGYEALSRNTTGNFNTAMGHVSMLSNTTGSGNTALGSGSLYNNSSGYSNVAIGKDALYHSNIRSNLVAIGDSALYFNSQGTTDEFAGNYNTAVGSKALHKNVSGSQNTGIGYWSLYSNTVGSINTAIGYRSLASNTDGYGNTALGGQALSANSVGDFNTAVGEQAIYNNSTGDQNVALGFVAIEANTTGSFNTGVGAFTLRSNSVGQYNTAIGYGAGMNIPNNLNNATAIGANAAVSCSNCLVLGNGANVGVGTSNPIAKLMVEGSDAVSNGSNAAIVLKHTAAAGGNLWYLRAGGPATTTPNGGFSIADNFGYRFVINSAGSIGMAGNVGIGGLAPVTRLDVSSANNWDLTNTEGDVRVGDANYRLKIGVALNGGGAGGVGIMQYGAPGGYNVMALGSQGNNVLFVNGNLNRVGIGTDNPAQKLAVNGNICYTGTIGACSDIRYKKNIQSIEEPLRKITSLRGFYYDWDKEKFADMQFSDQRQLGFSAQDVERLFPEIVMTDNKGYKSVDYGRITPVIVEAMKEQQAEITSLKAELNDLKKAILELKAEYK